MAETTQPAAKTFLKRETKEFAGGSEGKNPPANAGDVGLIPGPGRSHAPPGSEALTPQLPSPYAPEPGGPNYRGPVRTRVHALRQERRQQ